MDHFNPQFDARKHLNYGCQCVFDGDRPMSDPGFGDPVDELDVTCKSYKDCLKCARMQHGEGCIGEFVKYNFRFGKGLTNFVCRNDANTCECALFECDLMFAQRHSDAAKFFNELHFNSWEQNNWVPKEKCLKEDSKDPQGPPAECCSPSDGKGPAFMYNQHEHCCDDGRVVSNVDECDN